jgi:glutamyl-tRNA synthetase
MLSLTWGDAQGWRDLLIVKINMIKVRFAPSPTGYLHVGNVRTALINWLFAHKMGGQFVLRIDDTDAERSKKEYEDAIIEDLSWLGLGWDQLEHQSKRFARYHEAIEVLKKNGRLYPCYETQEELEVKRKMQSGRGLPPIYDRTALKLTEAQKATYEAENRPKHWRFLLNDGDVVWNDLVRGEVKFKATHMSDPILIREDGVPVYTLASVVDDGDFSITHVIRGEDHVSNSAVQVQLYEALGIAVPEFAHTALLKTKDGELSKRTGGGDIRSLRARGILPMAICSLLAKMGTSDAIQPFVDLRGLVEGFDFGKFSRSPANYDEEDLSKLNEKLLHLLPFCAVQHALPFADESFWNSVRGNLKSLDDAKMWHDVIHAMSSPEINAEDKKFLADAATLLPPEPWDVNVWDVWIEAIKQASGRKGKSLFMPLRLALTGMEHGPELKILLPMLGRDKTLARLRA